MREGANVGLAQRKHSNLRTEAKILDIRERVKITEKALCMMQSSFTATFRREATHLRTTIADLIQETHLLRAEMCKLKTNFLRELVQQKAVNKQLEDDIRKVRALEF